MATFRLHTLIFDVVEYREPGVAKIAVLRRCLQESSMENVFQKYIRTGRKISPPVYRNTIEPEIELNMLRLSKSCFTRQIPLEQISSQPCN